MAKIIPNDSFNGKNVNSVSNNEFQSNGGYNSKNSELLSTIERAISSTKSTENVSVVSAAFDVRNKSDLMFKGNDTITTTVTSIQYIQNHTKELQQKPKPFFSDEILEWSEVVLVLLLIMLIVITVIGNTLVILSVLTTRRLRTVTNCFVMSLAVADWLVGIFVMPPAVAVHLIGGFTAQTFMRWITFMWMNKSTTSLITAAVSIFRVVSKISGSSSWQLGWILCDIWISLDVLLCTASILSLCAISIDRYLAVTQPLNYSRRRRSKRLALVMILIVWVLALAITCPPILGWYEPGRRELLQCRYNQNEGYVVFSAMGSFFIPMAVMIYVYVRISCVVAARHDNMTEIEVHKKHNKHFDVEVEVELDVEPSSEQESQSPYKKRSICQKSSTSITTSTNTSDPIPCYKESNVHRNGHYELVDTTRQPSINRNKQKTNNNPSGNMKSCTHQYSIKQNNSSTCGEQHCPTKQIRTHHKSLSNKISSLKRENKTTQTLSIVVGGFVVCWLPFFVYYLITPFIPPSAVSGNLTNILTWLGWLNSSMNPFIYAFYSVDFRAAFWRLTFRRFFKNSLRAPYSSNAISIRR